MDTCTACAHLAVICSGSVSRAVGRISKNLLQGQLVGRICSAISSARMEQKSIYPAFAMETALGIYLPMPAAGEVRLQAVPD